MKKQVSIYVCFLLYISVVLSGCSLTVQSENEYKEIKSGDYTYTVLADGTAELLLYDGTETEDLEIPDSIDGIKITVIGSSAFKSHKELKSVSIPEGITEIKSNAFTACTGVESYSLPSTLKTIGLYVFTANTGLRSIRIPYDVEKVENGAFGHCSSLSYVSVKGKETKFDGNPFSECIKLSEIELNPDNVHLSIVNSAITDPTDRIFIGYLPGYGVQSGGTKTDIYYRVSDGLEEIGKDAFYFCSEIVEITLPETVKYIGDSAFCQCSKLEKINIPDGVLTIGFNAFMNNKSLRELVIPEATQYIGRSAFYGCEHLNIIVREGSYAASYATDCEVTVLPK